MNAEALLERVLTREKINELPFFEIAAEFS